jgi:C1A family cysteine protease
MFNIKKLLTMLRNKRLQRRLGCIPNKKDTRDRIHILVNRKAVGDQTKINLHAVKHIWNNNPFNQLSVPSCTANAISAAMSIMHYKKNTFNTSTFSRLFLYWYTRRLRSKNLTFTGTSIRDCFDRARNVGCCPETTLPYTDQRDVVNKQPPLGTLTSAIKYKGIKYSLIKQKTSNDIINHVINAIDRGKIIVFGTYVNSDFFEVKNLKTVHKPTGAVVGAHAMVILGYHKDIDNYLFYVLNSWGPKWGEKGMCVMHENYITWSNTFDRTVLERV